MKKHSNSGLPALGRPKVILYAGVYSNITKIYSYTACNTLTLAAELQPDVCQNELTSVAFVCCSFFSLCLNFFQLQKLLSFTTSREQSYYSYWDSLSPSHYFSNFSMDQRQFPQCLKGFMTVLRVNTTPGLRTGCCCTPSSSNISC